ncbi:MAG: ABC transporter substrate-binding protein [Chloroflexi bacterium]|nr:ABC transporter substrate-binding protein [Chloroflexota bacterium]
MSRKMFFTMIILLGMLVSVAGCTPTTAASDATPQTIIETVIVEGTPQVIEKVVTPTPVAIDKSGGVFTWAIPEEPPSFNPILSDNWTELYVLQFDSEPLTWGGENYPTTLNPILAETWETSQDGLVWTVHLRQGVKWHDGTEFTSEDVVFWASALQDPELPAAWFGYRFFTGEDPYLFEAIDDYTVQITTKEPVPNLLNLICVPLIPAHYFIENNITPKDMATEPFNTQGNIGTGPFKFGEYTRGEAVTLVRNDDYWRGKPLLDKVVFRVIPEAESRMIALLNGEVDWTQLDPQNVPQVVGNPNVTLHILNMDRLSGLDVNTHKPMLADKRTRQAMSYALDRQAIINTVMLGYATVADSPFNPVVSAYEPLPKYDYNPDKALSLLAEVGWEMGADGVMVAKNVEGVDAGTRFHIEIMSSNPNDQIATMVQSYLGKIGIEVEQKVVDFATYTEENLGKDPKNYDIGVRGGAFFGSDAGTYGTFFAAGDYQSTRGGYYNPDVQALFDQARIQKTQAEADVYYKQAAEIIWDEMPVIALYWPQQIWGASNRLHVEDAEMNASLLGVFTYPEKLWVEK